MVPVFINSAIQLPFQLCSYALRKLRLFPSGTVAHHSFPVAGLDEGRAHAVLYALRQAAMDVQEEQTAELWLVALQLAQIASDRLLRDLHTVNENLEFWQNRLHQGSHLRFMLFGQGPISFAHDVVSTLERKHKQRMTSATDKIERRVVVLRSLRSKLAEALAEIHSTATSLHLRVAKHDDEEHDPHATGRPVRTEQLFQQARSAVIQTSNSCSQVYTSLSSRVQQLSHSSALPHQGSTDNLVQQAALRHTLRRGSKKMFRVQGLPWDADDAPTRDGAAEDGEESASIQDAWAAVNKAQQTLHLSLPVGDPDSGPGVSANSALGTAAGLAKGASPLVVLPEWVRMPSTAAQHWVRYTALGVVSGWLGIFLYRHSSLSGSQDLERWAKSGADSVREAYKEHLLGPIVAVKDELFKTFRQRRSIVSTEEFEADKSSLRRMLADFEHDNAKLRNSSEVSSSSSLVNAGPNGEELIMPGMEFMMECYEDELKRPIRNLVSGQLARSLLIQVQKLKVDTESAMLEIDQILKANELSIALVAAIPSFLIAGVSLVGIWRWLSPKAVDPKWEALPCRMNMVELERTVTQLAEEGSAEMQGMFVYRLAAVYFEAYQLFQKHDLLSPHSEWPNVRQDLVELSGPLSVKQKIRITQRMMRVYTIFKF